MGGIHRLGVRESTPEWTMSRIISLSRGTLGATPNQAANGARAAGGDTYMRKTQKYVIVALHLSDLEHARARAREGGGGGAAAKVLLIALISWLVL